MEVPFQINYQKLVFRIDIKYSRQYTSVFPRIAFPRGRNTMKNFWEESAEARLLGDKGNEKHIPKNNCFPQ